MERSHTADVAAGAAPLAWYQVLRGLREVAGVTQHEWAAALGVGRASIQRWERGEVAPSAAAQRALIAYCGARGLLRAYLDGPLRGRTITAESLQDLLAAARRDVRAAVPDGSVSQAAVPPARTNLPRPRARFIGRDQERAEVMRLLAGTRLLTLTGSDGVGKTRLPVEVAAGRLGDYPDGVWLVDMAPLVDAALVPGAVAATLGIGEERGRSLSATLAAALRGRRMLLLFDNCDPLVAACADLAETLLRASAGLTLLVTSREPLRLVGEVVWRVPSLSLPPTDEQPRASAAEQLAAVGQSDAVRLFVDRAQLVLPGFALTETTAAAVADVCRRLDGIPLALELAAARLVVLSVQELAARLDDRFRLLIDGSRTASPRHQTLRATLDWSHALLSPPERALFRRSAVFVGGWTVQAGEAVCAGGVVDARETLSALGELVFKSLVLVEEGSAGERRSRLLETMREYAAEQLQLAGESDEVRARHYEWYAALAEDAARAPERLDSEYANIRAALAHALARGGGAPALRLAVALGRYWRVRGLLSEGRQWLDLTLAATHEMASTPLRAEAIRLAGTLAYTQGDYAAARGLLEESLQRLQQLDDRREAAAALTSLASIAYLEGRFEESSRLGGDALALRRQEGDRRAEARCLNLLGNSVKDMGDYVRAEALHREALVLQRALDDRVGIANSLSSLGNIAKERSSCEDARSLHQQALEIRRALGDRPGIATQLHNLGTVAHFRGEYTAAEAFYGESLRIRQELQDKAGVAGTLEGLGNVALDGGQIDVAEQHFSEALSLQREIDILRGGNALTGLAGVARARGDSARAAALLEEAVGLLERMPDHRLARGTLLLLGSVARERGDMEQAAARLRASLRQTHDLGDRRLVCGALEELAAIVAHDQPDDAVRLYGAAAALRRAIGAPRPVVDRGAYHRGLEAARAALAPDSFAAAWDDGLALPQDRAVELALSRAGDQELPR